MRLRSYCYVGLLLVTIAGCKAKGPSRVDQVKKGDAAMAKQQYADAMNSYSAAIDNGKPDAQVLVKYAEACMGAGRFRLATEPALRAARMLPNDVDVQLFAAQLLLMQRRFDEVKDRMNELVKAHPDNVLAQIVLGNATARLENARAVLLAFSGARTKEEFVRMPVNFRANSGPDVPGAATASEDPAAEEAFRNAVRLNPNDAGPQLALANFLWAEGRAAEAEPVLKPLADAHPEERIASLGLGVYYRMNNRPDEAEKYLRAASRDNGPAAAKRARETGAEAGKTTASFSLVDFYVEHKRDADAAELLNSLLPAYPVGAALRLAEIEFRTGKRDEAMKRVDALLAKQPPPKGAAAAKAKFLVEMKDTEKALPFARAAAASEPRSYEARTTLGRTLAAAGDREGAVDEYREAVHLNPLAVGDFEELAKLSNSLGKQSEAVAYAKEAKRLKRAIGTGK